MERIKELLRKLAVDLDDKWRIAQEDEQEAIQEYTETTTRINAELANGHAEQENLEAEVKTLEKCIIMQSGIVQSASAKLERNQKLANDAAVMCSTFEEEYHSASEGRKEELDLLAVIKQKVDAKFQQLEK